MPTLLLMAQALKILAGIAQLGFALWLVTRRPRTLSNVAFAISFGANGIAYTLFNTALPGQRTAGSVAVEGRAIFNWIATAAMMVFATAFLGPVHRRTAALVASIPITLAVLIAVVLGARAHQLALVEFGGIAINPATASVLAMLPIVFQTTDPNLRSRCAFLGAALAINSVDHLGAELVPPGPNPESLVIIQIAALTVVLALWLWSARWSTQLDSGLVVLIIVCMVAPFVAGVLIRVLTGSYRAVQETGFVGAGRLAATGVLAYGMFARGVFSASGVQTTSTSRAGGTG